MMWTGSVFMAAIIDWPVLRRLGGERFPFEHVVGQGAGVFPWVYAAITLMLVSSVGLAWLHWPTDALGLGLLAAKALALAFMAGSTIYGTLRTWPHLQFATDRDAYRLFGAYILRARLIFACGVLGHVFGVLFNRRELWLGV